MKTWPQGHVPYLAGPCSAVSMQGTQGRPKKIVRLKPRVQIISHVCGDDRSLRPSQESGSGVVSVTKGQTQSSDHQAGP